MGNLDLDTIIVVISVVLLLGYEIADKIIMPLIKKEKVGTIEDVLNGTDDMVKKFEIICSMASKFVTLAKTIFNDGEGVTKQKYVLDNLKAICTRIDFLLTDEELKAIIEEAYVKMKK